MSRRSRTPTCATSIASSCSGGSTTSPCRSGRGRRAPPPAAAAASRRRRARPRPRPARSAAPASARKLGRAVLQGLVRFPALIGQHAEAIAALPLAERDAARLRDLMLEAAMAHAALDPEALNTILAESGGAPLLEELGRKRGLAFSFTRRDAEPERACRDLALAIETLAARPGLDAALEAATARLKDEGDEAGVRGAAAAAGGARRGGPAACDIVRERRGLKVSSGIRRLDGEDEHGGNRREERDRRRAAHRSQRSRRSRS